MSDLYALHSPSTTLLLSVAQKIPRIVYWGESLNNWEGLALITDPPVPDATLDENVPFSLFAEAGRGLFCSPGIEGHRKGKDWSPLFSLININQTEQHLSLHCRADIADLEIKFQIILDQASDVFKFEQRIVNTGRDDYSVNAFNYTLPLPGYFTALQSYGGRWCQEWLPHRHSLDHGGIRLQNRTGRTSQQYTPAWLVGSPGFSEYEGQVTGLQLAWSGNHQFTFEVSSNGTRFVQVGELLLPGEINLASGESYECPALYLSHSKKGIHRISHQYHRFIRTRLLQWPTFTGQQNKHKERPVILNTWEGIYFDHQPGYIKQMAAKSASLGGERFVIDDGWFRERNGEKEALGDWFTDTKKYPDGLQPIIDYVKGQGLEFGLWVEPEMISPNSDLYRQHPDWVLQLDGYDQPQGRYQLVLNLQNPAAYAYIYKCLDELLTQHDIDYLKWDMNRELVQAGHSGRAAVHGQTLAFYRLLSELGQRHPHVEIESCASGGGRIDMGVLAYTHRFWTSDCNDALERVKIQNGFLTFFPPELMGAHLGASESHTTKRRHSLSFRAAVAMFGHFGLELDPLKLSAKEQQDLAELVDLHKKLRPILHRGEFYRLSAAEDPALVGWQVTTSNSHQSIAGIFQTAMPRYGVPPRILLHSLLPDKNYQVEVCLTDAYMQHGMKHIPGWMKQKTEVSGEWLCKGGLQLPVMDPESALIVKLEVI